MAFTGFKEPTTGFLAALAEHNSKTWFDAHREDYEAHWVAPAREFVEAAGEALAGLNPAVRAEPRINGSIFRVNRDIRFSQDKRPYKDHLDFWFWEGERKQAVSGFYLRVTPTHLGIGVGAHGFDKERLAAYRASVVDGETGPALAAAVDAVERAGWTVHGRTYKQLPRGFEAGNGFEERMLRHSALWCGEDEPHPASMRTARLVSYAMRRWEQLDPLHRWLVGALR
ncbi:MAG: TIGR02453 family protein [Acidobacteria bacterium]|nr:TIGR02453 family protein [Acidobacteriota bacterium]